ncbi:DNA glycosylase [Irpex rosettiformis]|uniref:DNA glycosylase n=1 Tax=Irpex rosettiformis TaxID=378272 RepID=A0ACB8TRV1_9APHY|nr:DNA glycosylase [Irpex rosettiformis]
MAKRSNVTPDIDSDGDYYDSSKESDASFTLTTTKKRTRQTNATSGKKRRVSKLVNRSKDSSDSINEGNNGDLDTVSAPHAMSSHVITDSAPLQEALLAWYAGVHEARGMPWRKPYDAALNRDQRAQRAYEVWISEIMLQQTQVVTVIPYYNRWMSRFPTINDLAASDIETVNALWKGLGYYSRAARLLAAAKKVVNELGGRLPDNARDMEAKIPGIGRYSAGAICSIAYNECVPVLDGNVNRLLSRVLALHANPKAKATLDILWTGAEAMVRKSERAGDINQALIELGATVCKVRDPDCNSCPLQHWCKAYRYEHADDPVRRLCISSPSGAPSASDNALAPTYQVPDIEELCNLCDPLPPRPSVTAFPMKVDRKKAREELDIVNVVEWRHHTGSQDRWFLLVKRPEGGLLAGLHEFPTESSVSKTLSATAMQEIPRRLLSDLLMVPPRPCRLTSKKTRNAQDHLDTAFSKAEDPLRIASIKSAGDITHIFSHIRKTYRIQWVVLEGGGDDPPSLTSRPSDFDIGGGTLRKSQKKKATTSRRQRAEAASPSPPDSQSVEPPEGGRAQNSTTARWLLMKDVPEANIGTGVLKVWKQVSTLWATEV